MGGRGRLGWQTVGLSEAMLTTVSAAWVTSRERCSDEGRTDDGTDSLQLIFKLFILVLFNILLIKVFIIIGACPLDSARLQEL